jgi:hypothetical protein
MRRFFWENGRPPVGRQNTLLLKPAISPAMLLWMPQNPGVPTKAISNVQISSKTAVLATAVVAAGVMLATTLHSAGQLENDAHFFSTQRSYDSTRRQITQEMSFSLLPVSDLDSFAMLDGIPKSGESGRRQVAHGLLPDSPAELRESTTTTTLGEVQSADWVRREIAGEILSRLVPWGRKFAATESSPAVYASVDRGRRQIVDEILPVLPHVISQPVPAKEPTGPPKIRDRIRRQIEALPRLLPNLSEGDPVANADGSPTAYDRLRRQTSLPIMPIPTVDKAASTLETFDSTITASTSASVQKQALTTPSDLHPTPKPKPKPAVRIKRVSAKKATSRCWNRIWRC